MKKILNNFRLIYKVFRFKKSIKNSVIHFILILLLVMYIFNFYLLTIAGNYSDTAMFKYPTYDAELAECSTYQFNNLAKNENTKSIVAFGPEICTVNFSYKDRQKKGTIYLLNDTNFKSLENTPFISKFLISKNQKIIENNVNTILISKGSAMYLKVKVGDTILLDLLNTKHEFIVGGILEPTLAMHMSPTDLNVNVVLIKSVDTFLTKLLEKNNNLLWFTRVYITFKDKEKGKKYIVDNYYHDKSLFEIYGEDYINKAPADFLERSKSGYSFRDVDYNRRKDLTCFKPIVMWSNGILSIIALIVLLTHERSKKIKLASKSIAVLISSGCSKKYMFTYFFTISMVEQLLIYSICTFLMKYIFYNEPGYHLPWFIIFKYVPLLISIAILSSLTVSAIAINLNKTNKLIKNLNEQVEVQINESLQ